MGLKENNDLKDITKFGAIDIILGLLLLFVIIINIWVYFIK